MRGAPGAEADRIEQVPTWPEEVPAHPRSRRSTYARLPERAWRAIAENSPPTAPIDLRAQSSRMDDLTVHATLGLALRMEASMLAVGASAADVTATVLRVAAGYGSANC